MNRIIKSKDVWFSTGIAALAVLLSLLLVACGAPAESGPTLAVAETQQPTAEPAMDTATPLPSATITASPSPSATEMASATPNPTDTSEPTPEPPTETASPSPAATQAASATPEPTDTPQPTLEPTTAPEPNPEVGAQLWQVKPCIGCHGPLAEGNIGPRLAGISLGFDQVLNRVRTGKAPMPAFTEQQVSDQELRDIYAWLKSLATPTPSP